MKDQSIVTLSIFKYNLGKTKIWAFANMGFGRFFLQNVPGLLFAKQLGTGAGVGFSLKPDFSKYSFLAVWKSETDADNFFNNSAFIHRVKDKAFDIGTVKLKVVQSKGKWDGEQPFIPCEDYARGPLAVLTRATINLNSLRRFWKHVPLSSKATESANGLLYSVGIGEIPWVKQATFSIWQDLEAMKSYAYTNIHKDIVAKTKKEKWYSEELFTRFNIVSSEGCLSNLNLHKYE